MVLKVQHIVTGAITFGTAMYGGYTWAIKSQNTPTAALTSAHTHEDNTCGGCAFDRLADVYDDIVGWEETSMFYGVLRWWLLRRAQGDVLELSAGTGRNLSHFPYSNMTSLTLTDVSTSMLQKAQQKYFDQLQLQYQHPDVSTQFLLADAQNMVALGQQQPHSVQPKPYSSSSHHGSGSGSSRSSSQHLPGSPTGSIWRFKKQDSSRSAAAVAPASDVKPTITRAADTPERGDDSAATAASSTTAEARDVSSSKGSWWVRSPSKQGSSSSSSSSSSNDSSTSSSSQASDAADVKHAHTPSMPGSIFAPRSFDTVVDTFGLCSCKDPVQVLRQASQLLKPGGKLLLLEHGLGTWNWVNSTINETAERHYRTYGCWYNRDILQIVEQAGLKIESMSRWHFGTSYMIVARPDDRVQESGAAVAEAA